MINYYGEFLKSHAINFPQKVAIKDDMKSVTYGQLSQRVNSVAQALLEIGLKKGDIVCQLQLNTVEHLEAVYSISRAGMIRLPLNPRANKEEFINLINFYEPRALIFEDDFSSLIGEIRSKLKCSHFIHVGSNTPKGTFSYESLANKFPEVEPNVEIGENEITLIQSTSGTTGLPKGPARSHNQAFLLDIFRALQLGYTSDDIVLCTTMLANTAAHAFAAAHLFVGGRVILRNKFDPVATLRIIEQERVTNTPMVPVMYEWILQLPELKNYDLSSLTQVQCYGAPLRTETRENIIKHICPNLFEVFGSTESGFLSILRPADQLRKKNCVGQLAIMVQHKLVGRDDQEVPLGKEGQIVVKTPYQFLGYFKNPEATSKVVRDGWYYTGDIGRFDEEFYLYIVGREKDMIVSGGYNIYADEVEQVLSNHPKILEAAVIGVPDEKWGEAVKACVVIKPGEKVAEDEIIEFCRKNLASYKRPRSVDFLQSLPRTDLGKVKKAKLREDYSVGKNRKLV